MTNHKKMAGEIFKSIGNAIGVHVLILVLEHALWQIKQKHENASLISFSEDGINFDVLEGLNTEEAGSIAHDFILAIIDSLGRLVGKQLVHQLTKELYSDSDEEGE